MTDEANPTDSSELGPMLASYAPSKPNMVAGFIFCNLFTVGGAYLVYWPLRAGFAVNWKFPPQKEGWNNANAAIVAILGGILFIVGIFVSRSVKSLYYSHIDLHEDGFHSVWGSKDETFRWDQLDRILEITWYERPPLLKGVAQYALPKFKSSSYELYVNKKQVYRGWGTKVKEIKHFGEMLRVLAQRHNIPWENQEIHC